MGLFGLKKKKEEEKEEISSITSVAVPPLRFPEIEEIKNAVKPMASPIKLEQPKLQPLLIPKITKTIEMPKIETSPIVSMPLTSNARVTREIDETIEPMEQEPTRESGIAKLREPIFVKIDKFEDALSNFEEIKKRLHESFELLEKIKRIRGKEEEEIDAWEKEIEEIKAKMFELDKKLFSRVEF